MLTILATGNSYVSTPHEEHLCVKITINNKASGLFVHEMEACQHVSACFIRACAHDLTRCVQVVVEEKQGVHIWAVRSISKRDKVGLC